MTDNRTTKFVDEPDIIRNEFMDDGLLMVDNQMIEKLIREFVAIACECEVRDCLIAEYAERIEQAIADELNAERDKWKAKAEEAGRAMNAAAGLWAKADAENRELQAKCDELNAKLGSGTCEPNWVLQGETQTQEFWRCECGNCGECFGVEERDSFPFRMTIDKVDIPNYCPNCGAKVVK